jgi:hypothetical protein
MASARGQESKNQWAYIRLIFGMTTNDEFRCRRGPAATDLLHSNKGRVDSYGVYGVSNRHAST